MKKFYRIGQIVPSSNITMEKEIPQMLLERQTIAPERFTFHSSRMRMKSVTKAELEAMDADSDRCALELSDAHVDVLGYACLVAIMSMGHGYHRASSERLHQVTLDNGAGAPVITSAGALVNGLNTLGAKRVAILAPYMRPLTQLVVDYIQAENITVTDWKALEIPDNLTVGNRSPLDVMKDYKGLDLKGIDALVISACVQMPSLDAIPILEQELGIPVVSSAVCTTYDMLKALNLKRIVPNAGTLLNGDY